MGSLSGKGWKRRGKSGTERAKRRGKSEPERMKRHGSGRGAARLVLAFLALAVLAPAAGCGQAARKTRRYESQYYDLFDTITTFVAYEKDEEAFRAHDAILYEELSACHRLFDIYHDYDGLNNIKTINDNAGIRPVEVDRRIIDLLLYGRELYDETDGAVNIAMGSVLSLWHTYREAGLADPEHAEVPPEKLLREAAEHTDITRMVIDEGASTVYLEDPRMSLDVGAVAKGCAAERAAERLMEEGLTGAMINAGGNIRTIGAKGDGTPWAVGIQNPDPESGEAYLHTMELRGESLVTSGTYQRFYTVDGVQYHHIIHPSLLAPWREYASVTILCGDSARADGLSTAVFNMEAETGLAFIESLDGVEAMWIRPDGTEIYSSGFRNFMKKE